MTYPPFQVARCAPFPTLHPPLVQAHPRTCPLARTQTSYDRSPGGKGRPATSPYTPQGRRPRLPFTPAPIVANLPAWPNPPHTPNIDRWNQAVPGAIMDQKYVSPNYKGKNPKPYDTRHPPNNSPAQISPAPLAILDVQQDKGGGKKGKGKGKNNGPR